MRVEFDAAYPTIDFEDDREYAEVYDALDAAVKAHALTGEWVVLEAMRDVMRAAMRAGHAQRSVSQRPAHKVGG